jgi:hypothetical protein
MKQPIVWRDWALQVMAAEAHAMEMESKVKT